MCFTGDVGGGSVGNDCVFSGSYNGRLCEMSRVREDNARCCYRSACDDCRLAQRRMDDRLPMNCNAYRRRDVYFDDAFCLCRLLRKEERRKV